MKKILTGFFVLILFCVVTITQAQEVRTFSNNLGSLPLGDLSGQDNWVITKHNTDSSDTVQISTSDLIPEEKFIEIVNDNSLLASWNGPPLNNGVFEFQARHNKEGLFYLYAQTSDNGGQLLFSIQFTEANGILLEESDSQIALLPDYNKDQWYYFIIDFDNTKGSRGTFTVQIDNQSYGEYEYVQSESSSFDFAQITIGSESTGKTSISAFVDSFSTALSNASSTTSNDLLQLSISLSSTSISSNLENGLIVTASLDGIASVATSSIFATDTVTSTETGLDVSTSTESEGSSGIGSFLMNIVESVIDIFRPEADPVETKPASTPPVASEATSTEPTPTEPAPTEPEPTEPAQTEPTAELPTVETTVDEPAPENELPSSITTDDATNNEINTTTF